MPTAAIAGVLCVLFCLVLGMPGTKQNLASDIVAKAVTGDTANNLTVTQTSYCQMAYYVPMDVAECFYYCGELQFDQRGYPCTPRYSSDMPPTYSAFFAESRPDSLLLRIIVYPAQFMTHLLINTVFRDQRGIVDALCSKRYVAVNDVTACCFSCVHNHTDGYYTDHKGKGCMKEDILSITGFVMGALPWVYVLIGIGLFLMFVAAVTPLNCCCLLPTACCCIIPIFLVLVAMVYFSTTLSVLL